MFLDEISKKTTEEIVQWTSLLQNASITVHNLQARNIIKYYVGSCRAAVTPFQYFPRNLLVIGKYI